MYVEVLLCSGGGVIGVEEGSSDFLGTGFTMPMDQWIGCSPCYTTHTIQYGIKHTTGDSDYHGR